MKSLRMLQGAMMLQIVLGLWRFIATYAGWPIPARVWQVHPLLGVAIAVAALILFRPLRREPSDLTWSAARYVALAPLVLGLSMRYGVVTGLAAMLAHMAVGLTALGLIDSAIKRESSRRSRAAADGQPPSTRAQVTA